MERQEGKLAKQGGKGSIRKNRESKERESNVRGKKREVWESTVLWEERRNEEYGKEK